MNPFSRLICLALLALAPSVHAAPPAGGDRLPGKNWLESSGDRFTVISDTGRRDTEKFAREFEIFRAGFSRILPGLRHDLVGPVRIYLFANRSSFATNTFQEPDVAGYFFTDGHTQHLVIRADGDEQSTAFLYHEYVHMILKRNVRVLRPWMNEGIASFFETFRVYRDKLEFGRPNPGRLNAAQRGAWLPIDELVDARRIPGESIRAFYAQSWSMAHYLMTRDGAEREQVRQLMVRLEQDEPASVALQAAFGVTLDEFRARLRRHVDRRAFTFFRMPSGEFPPGTAGPPRALTPSEAAGRLGHLALFAGPPGLPRALTLLNAALRSDPDDVVALLDRAVIHRFEEEWEQARTLVDKALRLAPDNPRANVMSGELYLLSFNRADGTIPAAGAPTAPDLLLARAAYRRAYEADPTFVSAYNNYAHTFIYGAEPLEPITRSMELFVRDNPDLIGALTLMELYARAGDRVAAGNAYRTHVTRILDAGSTHGPDASQEAYAVRAAIEADVLLAEVWARRGRTDEAIQVLRDALDRATDVELRGTVTSRIEALLARSPTAPSSQPNSPSIDR